VDALEIVWPLPEDLDDGRRAAMFYLGFDPASSLRYAVFTFSPNERSRSPDTRPFTSGQNFSNADHL